MKGHNPKSIKPISDEKALEYGANFLGEVMVFSAGALVAIFEYSRKYFADQYKAEKKKRAEEEAASALERRFKHLEENLSFCLAKEVLQQKEIEELGKKLEALEKDSKPPSWFWPFGR